jgi:hypothetical protein
MFVWICRSKWARELSINATGSWNILWFVVRKTAFITTQVVRGDNCTEMQM